MKMDNARFFKMKKPSRNFLCALCSTPRQMKYKRNLSMTNYFQLTVLGGSLSYFLYPLFGAKTLFLTFIVWMVVEVANKILYRNELPCPHCGFDATWYRRDVKVARQKVETFWNARNPVQEPVQDKEQIDSIDINNANLNAASNPTTDQLSAS